MAQPTKKLLYNSLRAIAQEQNVQSDTIIQRIYRDFKLFKSAIARLTFAQEL